MQTHTNGNGIQPEFVSIKSLSVMLEIPEKTIRTWVYKRSIPFYKIGRLVRFDLEKIRVWFVANPFRPLNKERVVNDSKV